MLHADSWRAMMNDLSKHFGSDASLDEKRRAAITDFLVANAGGRKTGTTRDARASRCCAFPKRRFVKKHREISAATWQRASIKSPANCSACHTQAAAGDYNDDTIRIPK